MHWNATVTFTSNDTLRVLFVYSSLKLFVSLPGACPSVQVLESLAVLEHETRQITPDGQLDDPEGILTWQLPSRNQRKIQLSIDSHALSKQPSCTVEIVAGS